MLLKLHTRAFGAVDKLRAAEPGCQPRLHRLQEPVDRARRERRRLLWNGDEVSLAQIREFLGLVNEMNPQPLMVLSYSVQAPAERLRRARLLIEEVIGCRPRECLEIIILSA